jgi:hypothetical protein
MTYEIHPDATETEEYLAERLNEFLINDLGINTDDFLVVADGESPLSVELQTDVDSIEQQLTDKTTIDVVVE